MNHKKVLILILILALFFRIVYSIPAVVPIFEKPDEKQHFEYIELLYDTKKLHVVQPGERGEAFHPPLFHTFAALILGVVKMFSQNLEVQVFSIRLLSVIVSMFTLYFVYKIASLLFQDKTFVLGVVTFASFLPTFINWNTSVTNASLAHLFSTIIIYLLLIILSRGENNKILMLLGIITAASLLTRISTFSTILTIPLAFLIRYYSNIKKMIKPMTIIALIVLVLSGWYLIRNFILYGDFLGVNALRIAHTPYEAQISLLFFIRLVGWSFLNFWAAFGVYNQIFIGNLTSISGIIVFLATFIFFAIITIISLFGLYRLFKRYLKNRSILNDFQKKAFLLFIFQIFVIGSSILSYNLFQDFQPHGKLFYPAIAAISIFFTLGFYNFVKKIYREKFLHFYIASFVVLNIISIISIAYHLA